MAGNRGNKSNGNGHSRQPVIVIGGGLGGLSAAIHLRLAGREVKLFEANERVGGRASRIERDGFKFDTGPTLLNYPWVFENLFRAAGRELNDYVTLLPVDPSVAFQWMDGTRFTLSSNLQHLLAECERLEPGSRPRAIEFLRDAGVKYRLSFDKLVTRNEDNPLKWIGALTFSEMARLSIWRSLDRELRRFFKSRHIREALGSYGMYLGGSPYDLPGLFSILPYGELAYGLWLPKGSIKMTPGVMTFYWGVRGAVKNLGHHTIFLPNDFAGAFDDLFRHKQIPRHLPFYVAAPSATDPDLAPAGDTAIFVLAPTPLLSEMNGVDWLAEVQRVKRQVLERLWHHDIDLDPERIAVEEIFTPEDWRRRFGLFDGSAFGAAHTLFQVGPFRARNYSREVAGLFYVGASTTPGTGMPMVVLGGKLTAERVLGFEI